MKVFIFAVGNFPKNPKKMYQALGYIKEQDGMLGIHPCYPDGNLLVWDTLNNAKIAKNNLEAVGIRTANHIMSGTLTDDKQFLTVLDPVT